MTRTAFTLAAAFALLAVAGCSDDNGDGPLTTTRLAEREIRQNTAESAAAIELNDLPISDADTTESGRPPPL